MKCPICSSKRFFIKDPDDPYETYPFEIQDDQPAFDPEVDSGPHPEIEENTETYCEKCAWHGRIKEL